MDKAYIASVVEGIKKENEKARENARLAVDALSKCGVISNNMLLQNFIVTGCRDATVYPIFVAFKMGGSPFKCLSDVLKSWKNEGQSDFYVERCEVLRRLLVEVGPEGATRPPDENARITTMMEMWSMWGDPIALSIALSMPGVDARALACEPEQEEGRLPLAMAAASPAPGAMACCEMLMNLGADPNRGMNFEVYWTPLRSAIRAKNENTCFLLASRGGDPALGRDGHRVDDEASPDCLSAIKAGLELRLLSHGVPKASGCMPSKALSL